MWHPRIREKGMITKHHSIKGYKNTVRAAMHRGCEGNPGLNSPDKGMRRFRNSVETLTPAGASLFLYELFGTF